MGTMPRWRWIFLAGLCASILTLAFVCVDRSHLPLMFGLVVFGSVCWILCWRFCEFKLSTIIAYAVLFRLILFGVPPSLSDDAYRYVWDGLIQHQGANPYQFTPEEAPFQDLKEEVTYEGINSKSFISVYPPVSQLIFRLGTRWHTPDSDLSYYLVKGIFILTELLAIFVLAKIVSSGFVLLYAWNPVVILETAGQAHTESAVLLALALVIYFAGRNQTRWASVFLAVAGWIKLFPFIFFPFLWRRYGWSSIWPGIVVVLVLALPFAGPFVIPNVTSSLDLYVHYFEFNSGLYYGFKTAMTWLTGDDWSKQLGPFLRLLFLGSLPLIYILDQFQRWSLARAMLIVTGFYLILSTTVHPWYLLVPLFLLASIRAHGWHWIWLSLASVGTYLLYVEGPYWTFVIIGWLGWGIIALIRYAPKWMQSILHSRAEGKFKRIRPYFPRLTDPLMVLDLGCAEGYVGAKIQKKLGATVVLADVISLNRTDLPFTKLEHGLLPWPSNYFDVVLLNFVLHHAEDAESLFQEAIRVSRGRVIVVESAQTTPTQAKLLRFLDQLANRLRSFGKMRGQEEYLCFRTSKEWRELFLERDAVMLAEFRTGRGPFTTTGFVLRPNDF